jgi:RNA polymerase sigma-70 factor (ECF subfamily)
MAQVKSGDAEALERLYDRFSVRALRVAWSVSSHGGRAEDAVQEAFVSIWRSRGSYQPGRGPVAAWILAVVRHRAVDLARRDDKHAARRAPYDAIDRRPAHDDVVAQAVDRHEAEHLKMLLARLPDVQREVIALAFYGQLTHSEIAATLGLPPGTVKGRMRLGLDKLRTELARDPTV